MPRRPRFLPENRDGVLVEITCRTIGARALLTPEPEPRRFNEVLLGVFGRALEVSPVELCGVVVLANHLHALVVVHEQQELSRFMQHLGANLSKEVGGRLRKWRGAFWERRYDGIVVSDEPEAQWARMKYLLSNSVKEGLVESPLKWPGVHGARALVHGEPLEGYWFNRTKEWAARHRGLNYGRYDFATRYLIDFAPLPAFRHLSPEAYQEKVAELVREIEEESEVARAGNPVASVEKILRQDPYEPPTLRTKRSTKPNFHVKSREARAELRTELDAFLMQYWAASEELRRNRALASARGFPHGCYPPALAFVGDPPPPCPPSPPTRLLLVVNCEVVERGEIPAVEVPTATVWRPFRSAPSQVARARGQPP